MGWTLPDIRDKIRKLTGKRSTNQMSNDDIDDRINNYYQWDFPVEIGSPEFDDWYEFNTTQSDGDQDIPETVLNVEPPVFIDDARVSFYTDEEAFWDLFPWDQTGSDYENEPNSIFVKGRTIYIRPVPDDAYSVKIKARTTKPTALSGSAEPGYEGAGPMIAYGVAILIAQEDGDEGKAASLTPTYEYYKGLVTKRATLQIPPQTRSTPRF